MSYIICNDDNYLLQTPKGYSITNNMECATKWKKNSSAKNVCATVNGSKKFQAYQLEVKYITQENHITNPPAIETELKYDILEKVKEISEFTKNIEERRLYLMEKIHEADLDIVDIEHAAEFYSLNASQGYKLYKMLHDIRRKRREYKDELEKINLSLGTSIRSKNMENLERSIIGLNNRKYEPRINRALFGV